MSQYGTQSGQQDCLICAGARPTLRLVKTAFEQYNITTGTPGIDLACLLTLMARENPGQECEKWEKFFPMAPANVTPPVFYHGKVYNVTCFENNNTADRAHRLGRLTDGCRRTITLTGKKVTTQLTVSRADVWWYCCGRTLYNWLLPNLEGKCALVSLSVPVQIVPQVEIIFSKDIRGKLAHFAFTRQRRNALLGSETRNLDGVWIDAIRQARNIPDEYKLADEVAAGFESFPQFSAIFPVTVNKNGIG